MEDQLELSQHELEAIGFRGHYAAADDVHPEQNPARVWYSIPVTNAEFIYNVENAPYKWYFRTKVGDAYNSNWLNIQKLPELYMLLSCFKAQYNLILL